MKKITEIFIIVDDDPENNYITKHALKKTLPGVALLDFTNPELAIEYIKSKEAEKFSNAILLLDINMPQMSAWEFLDKLEYLPPSVHNRLNIYINSSSVNPSDIERSRTHPRIIDFIEKPLSKEVIEKFFVQV